MTTCERQIHLSEAQIGMQLARDVGSTAGPTLIALGTILDGDDIASLSRHGILEIWITHPSPLQIDGPVSNPAPNQTKECRLNQLFRQSTGFGDEVRLLELLTQYKSGNPP